MDNADDKDDVSLSEAMLSKKRPIEGTSVITKHVKLANAPSDSSEPPWSPRACEPVFSFSDENQMKLESSLSNTDHRPPTTSTDEAVTQELPAPPPLPSTVAALSSTPTEHTPVHDDKQENDYDVEATECSVFTPYISIFNEGAEHPTPLCTPTSLQLEDSASMKARLAPFLHADLVLEPNISAPQLDAIAMARMRNSQGHGFQNGDAVGVGKTRIAVGWIRNNNLFDGMARVIFVSVGSLFEDLKRDASAAGFESHFQWTNGKDVQSKSTSFIPKDDPDKCHILFLSHDILNSFHIANLLDWVFEGRCTMDADLARPSIVIDESHRVVKCSGSTKSTRAERAYKLLNTAFERGAHIMTLSGTFAANVQDLELNAGILGLCGSSKDSTLPSWSQARRVLTKLGAAGLEAVCAHLRLSNSYCARSLSMSGISSLTVSCGMSDADASVYARCAQLFEQLRNVPGVWDGVGRSAQFYGASLRFFRALLTSLKVEATIDEAIFEISRGRSPIICVLSTDEASIKRNVVYVHESNEDERRRLIENGALHDTIFNLIDNGRVYYPAASPALNHIRETAAAIPLSKISSIDRIKDALARHLGNERSKIVELTGRRHHCNLPFGEPPELSNWTVCKQTETLESSKARFQAGDAEVAILSSAASTGISLHHANSAARPRTMIVLELPWTSVQFVQTCGRIHRSNQITNPIIKLVTCKRVMAEQRFASTIQKRMAELGATTSADSRVNGVVEFDSPNLCCRAANAAAEYVASEFDIDLGSEKNSIRLMNRALAYPIEKGNEIMGRLVEETKNTEEQNTLTGKTENTIKEIVIDGVKMSILERFDRHAASGSQILTIGYDVGISFAHAKAIVDGNDEIAFYKESKDEPVSKRILSNVVIAKVVNGEVVIKLPSGAKSSTCIETFNARFVAVDGESVKELWDHFFNISYAKCGHRRCTRRECSFGRRIKKTFVLTFPLLDYLYANNIPPPLRLVRMHEKSTGASTLAIRLNMTQGLSLIEKSKRDAVAKLNEVGAVTA